MDLSRPRSWLAGVLLGVVAVASAPVTAAAADLRLLMFERDGCIYCKRWNDQIGPAYPRTPEGAAAPLQRVNIRDPLPAGVTLSGRFPVLTPTFVLTADGAEVGRLEGYAGDEFFWPLLDGLLDKAGWTPPGDPAQAATGAPPAAPARPPSNATPTTKETAP